ncbi:uncharacterized protein [Struthio camelus]|uniref:uncharacterized protein isoform X2 n=1 Tax=Struthio camelus TaxID=8801 RepID=UPI003603CA31
MTNQPTEKVLQSTGRPPSPFHLPAAWIATAGVAGEPPALRYSVSAGGWQQQRYHLGAPGIAFPVLLIIEQGAVERPEAFDLRSEVGKEEDSTSVPLPAGVVNLYMHPQQ